MNVPTPEAAFRWTTEAWGLALRCRPLESHVQHLFTSSQLELPPSRAGEAGSSTTAAAAWTKAAHAIGRTTSDIVRVRQVHGRAVRVVRRGSWTPETAAGIPDGDAIVSDEPGLVLAVVVADCVPILMVDTRTGASAAIHAGWRGTCAGIARETVEAMARELGTRPADVIAAIGPSIGPDDYEVGESVRDAFRDAGHEAALVDRWFIRRDDTRPHLDLWQANRDQLEGAGVTAQAIWSCGLSTCRYPGVFESYRRDGTNAGRMAAVVAIPNIED